MLVPNRPNGAPPLKPETVAVLAQAPGLPRIIRHMLSVRSPLMSVTPRSIGIEMAAHLASGMLQKSLDVKHVKKAGVVEVTSELEQPNLKIDLLYTHPTKAWIRFYCPTYTSAQLSRALGYPVLSVCEHIHELYCGKQPPVIYGLIHWLHQNLNPVDIIFCSELAAFYPNTAVFFSNYLKFMWCYRNNRAAFDPRTSNGLRDIASLVTYGSLFLHTNNLSNMPGGTHGPVTACSGERPKVALGKFTPGQTYINRGSRAMQALTGASDLGCLSNMVNVITRVEIDDRCMENII